MLTAIIFILCISLTGFLFSAIFQLPILL
jgi:hypothetical protein